MKRPMIIKMEELSDVEDEHNAKPFDGHSFGCGDPGALVSS